MRDFHLDDEMHARSEHFIVTHPCTVQNEGFIGGKTSYRFTDTSIGQVAVVRCVCDAEEDLTDYSQW